MMLNQFEYMEVEAFNANSTAQIIKTAHDYAELETILQDFYDKYDSAEWKITKTGYVNCDCGKTVACTSFTNTCTCGADYNFAGQRLAPRSQWGEETGEHWRDCL